MEDRIIKSLKKSGLNQVEFNEYLTSNENNIFSVSDNKGLLYVNIDGKNHVISDRYGKESEYIAVEMKINSKPDLLDVSSRSAFIATNNGIFVNKHSKDNEINRLYNSLSANDYAFFILMK